MLTKFLIGITLTIFSIGTYFIWFDKRNIFNHISIGFCFVAYVIPAFVINYTEYFKPDVISLYVWISIIGCLFYMVGMFLGYKWKALIFVDTILQFRFLNLLSNNSKAIEKIGRLSSLIYIVGVVGVIVSFMLMGFVPLFASDPYMARFFKGQYQQPYERVAFLYRTSRQLVELLMPLKVLELFIKFNFKSIFLILMGIVAIAVSLNRGPILYGTLIGVSIFVALKKRNAPFWIFILVIFSSYIIGSSMFYIIGLLFPDSIFGLGVGQYNIFEAIASGAPDIKDQINFLSAFLYSGSHYTYGLTIFGGLIPFNFPWNPAVYTLTILNDTNDISEIVSGGLRLPVSIWGYVSFGWIGVAILPFFSGFLTGYIVKKVKKIINGLSENTNGYILFFFLYFMYTNIGAVFMSFFTLSIYSLPAFAIYYLYVKKVKLALN
ncbi:O-antigen polymerase [uncultured Mucilaginibacter sp.]|uniref:O-antigen polymerase n=1 Tax=uncultured Mucilaginibacter sp. TaxID=797541 RepID=UPI0025F7B3ED|nr:O-antigen polymerase [uncultured Mucilaginibacter sp.]